MLIRVLGPVSLLAAEGDAVTLPGPRQTALLALLAAQAGETVSADRLVDVLWGDAPPANPTAALRSTVFKVRAAVSQVTGREVVVTRERGYALDLRPGDLDADVFAHLVDESRGRVPGEAAETLQKALGLWRGAAYGGPAEGGPAHLEALRLEELRQVAVERYGAALLGADRTSDAVLLLQPFVAEHPLREAARATLMEALHAVGRTPEALSHYQSYREHLADELGLEPSRALRELQVTLLQPAGPPATATARRVAPGLPGMTVHYLRTAADTVIAYGNVGTGPGVVVLMGWISSLDVIASGRDPRSSVLDRLTDDLRLTLYDRAGTGLSPGPVTTTASRPAWTSSPPWSAPWVRRCRCWRCRRAGRWRWPWRTASRSGSTCWCLLGTFADGPATFTDHRMTDMIVEITRSHWGIGSRMLADLYRPSLSDEAVRHLARVFRDSASAEVSAAYLEQLYPQDVSKLLPEIATPTLVLHYRSDRLIPFHGGQQIAAGLPNATFLPLDGRVHLPDAADLDLIEEAVVSHIRRHQR